MTALGVNRAVLTLTLTLFFLASGARPAVAQGFISPFLGFNFGGDSGCQTLAGCEDKNVNFGVSFGSLGPVFGIEGEFAYIPNFFGETPGISSNVLSFMGNLMLAPRLGAVQPYGLVGLGLLKTRVELSGTGLLETSNNHFGWDVGGGLIVFPGQHVGIKGDIRYFHAFQDLEILGIPIADAKLDYGRASVGVVFRF